MEIKEKLLTSGEYVGGYQDMGEIEAIAIHNTMLIDRLEAEEIWDFWEHREPKAYGSAHYVVGNWGEVLRTIPDVKIAYHVGASEYTKYKTERFGGRYPNAHVIGIELCHPDWSGAFPPLVLASARQLCVHLVELYGLDPMSDIITHNFITGKACPRWWVERPYQLDVFRMQVRGLL